MNGKQIKIPVPKKVARDGSQRGVVKQPTPKQKLAVDLLVSGRAKNLSDAARKAGYSENSALDATRMIVKSSGVQVYLEKLDAISKEKFGLSIADKVMNTYFEALDATKLYGKNAEEHADTPSRIAAADRLSRFLGWEASKLADPNEDGKEYNQFNFFNVNPEKQKLFHENLKSFIKKSYNGGGED